MKRKKIQIMNLKVSKPKKINLYLGKHRKDLKLTWPQVKRKYPKLKSHADSDFDGTLNLKDCHPLNPAKDKKRIKTPKERFQEFLKKKAGGKTGVRIGKRLAGVPVGKAKRAKVGPGRPVGEYKHISPLTGQKVPATVYYKHRREVRRRIRRRAEQADIREQAIMARRGISPQTTRIRQQMRERVPTLPEEEVAVEEETPIEEVPTEEVEEVVPTEVPIPPTYPTYPTQVPLQQRFRIVTDLMTGRQIIKPILPPERWTR